MIPVEDYCDSIDANQPNFIEMLIKQGKVSNKKKRLDELTDAELEEYDALHQAHKEKYTQNWRYTIKTHCRFKQPSMVNFEILDQLKAAFDPSAFEDKLYVFPCFAKPGKNYYMVRLDPPSAGSTRQLDLTSKDLSSSIRDSFGAENEASSECFAHSIITPYRTEDLPGFVKQSRSQKVERTFNKNNSVFKEWKQDTAQRLDDCLEHDVALWKVPKFVKDKEELKKCTALIKKDFATFKMIYTYYATLAAYPYINAECMLRFVKDFKMMDKNLTQELVVTAYTGSWTTPKKTPGTQPDHLLRF